MKNEIISKIPLPRQNSNHRDPGNSIKLSEISTLKKGHSKLENKIKIEQSLSEIKLEEVNSSNDPNITYLSILKKREKQKENNITNDDEILPTNLSTKEKVVSPKEKIKIIKLKIKDPKLYCLNNEENEKRGRTFKTMNNLAQSQFSEISFINGEEKLKNLVKRSMKSQNTSRSQKSSKLYFNHFREKNIIEIKNFNQYSNFELSKIVFDILHQAPPETVIILPPRYISLPYLILNYPVIIIGSPGTLVEINNGNIILSNDLHYDNKDPKGKIYISECSFVFNLEIKSFIEKVKYDDVLNKNVIFKNGIYKMPLIKLQNNTSLEIHDCDFRAIVHNEENIIDGRENRLIYETCFNLNEENEKELNCELSLFSTICSNFYRILSGHNVNTVLLENCHLSDCVDDAINIKNVKNITLKNNIIANCKNGLKISYDYTNFHNLTSTIKLFENEITQNNQVGISINSFYNMSNVINFNFDLKFKAQLSIEIIKNKLIQNKQIAISIENLFVDNINLSENEIKYNVDSGVVLNSVCFNPQSTNSKMDYFNENLDKSMLKLINQESVVFLEKNTFKDKLSQTMENKEFNLIFNKNLILENKNNKGVLFSNLKNCKLLMNGSQITNNLTGIEMTKIFNKSIMALIVDCLFNENMGDGFAITNSALNNFLFKNCKFDNNYTYGLNLKVNEYNYSLPNNNEIGLKFDIPFIFLVDSQLNGNKVSGIFLKNNYLNIDSCFIKDNGKWALNIPLEANKNLIKLYNFDKKLNLMINNPMGGEWGLIATKKSFCSDGQDNCYIL